VYSGTASHNAARGAVPPRTCLACMTTQPEGLPESSRGLRSEASAERRYLREKAKRSRPRRGRRLAGEKSGVERAPR
jgi:hypothetical protein